MQEVSSLPPVGKEAVSLLFQALRRECIDLNKFSGCKILYYFIQAGLNALPTPDSQIAKYKGKNRDPTKLTPSPG